MKRRGFMGGIAAALATTPEKVLKASGVSSSPIGAGSILPQPFVGSYGETKIHAESWRISEKMRFNALKMLNPWWFERKRRMDAHPINALDPNIAALRSVSPQAKIAMQRELQYRTQFEREIEFNEIGIFADQFQP